MSAPPSAYLGLTPLPQTGSVSASAEPPPPPPPPSPPRPLDSSHDASFVPAAPATALWGTSWNNNAGPPPAASPSSIRRPAASPAPHSHAHPSAAHLDPWGHGGTVWRPASSPLHTSTTASAANSWSPAAEPEGGAGAAGETTFSSFHRDLADSFSTTLRSQNLDSSPADMNAFSESLRVLNVDARSHEDHAPPPSFESRPHHSSFPSVRVEHSRQRIHGVEEDASYAHLYGAARLAGGQSPHASQFVFPTETSGHFLGDSVAGTSASDIPLCSSSSQQRRVPRDANPNPTQGTLSLSCSGRVPTSMSSRRTPGGQVQSFAGGKGPSHGIGNGNGNGHGGRSRSSQRRRRRTNGDGGFPSTQNTPHSSQQRGRNGYHSQPQSSLGGSGGRRGNVFNGSGPQNGGGGGSGGGAGPVVGGGTGGQGPSVREYNRRISACARRRDLNGALQALADVDASPTVQRNLFTYNAVINALVMCSQYARADQLWKEMIESGIQPNLVTYNTRLKSCFSGTDADVERAFDLVREMESNRVAPDRVTYNSLINSCVAAGRVDDARRVYEEMQRKRIVADDFTFTTLAKAGASQNNIDMLDALLVHQLEHHAALRKKSGSHPLASNGAGGPQKQRHSGSNSGGSGTGKFGSQSGKSSNSAGGVSGGSQDSGEICPVAYNAIADAYIRCGRPNRALELLNRMRDPKLSSMGGGPPSSDCIPVAPDVQSFNVKLKALREAGASTKEAFSALEEMQALGLETDHISLLTLADLCCRRGEMGLAEGVLRVATSADVRESKSGSPEWSGLAGSSGPTGPLHGGIGTGAGGHRRNNNQPRSAKANASLFNALIRGYSSLDPPNVEAAVALYAEMRRFVEVHGFHFYAPDSVTYTMLVDSFARVGNAERAEQIISEMEAAGPGSTSVVAFNAFLKANRGAGSVKAFEIFERIKARGLTPDLVTINQLVDILSSEQNGMQLAERLVGEMPKWGLTPDLHTYNCLIKGAARSKGFNQNPSAALNSAFHWLRELRKSNLRADEFTYQSMTAACAAAGDAPRALQFFRCVEEERARRMRGTGASSPGIGPLPSSSGSAGAAASRSASTGSIPDMRRSLSGGSAVTNGAGFQSLEGANEPRVPDPSRSNSPSRVDVPSGLSHSGQSVGANLMMLGSHAGLMDSSLSASNTSTSRNGSGGNTGSSSSAGSNDDFLLLAHPAAYVALMRAFLSSGREDGVDATLRLRDEMVDRGLELGRSGYTAVADAYAERGDSEKVEETLREMVAREPAAVGTPNLSPVHHSIRMKSLCKQGRIDDAIALLPEVENPDAGVFNTLLFAVGRTKDRHRMMTILRAMENAGIEPDAITGRAMQPLMRSLARTLRSFDDRFQDRISTFVGNRGSPDGDGSGKASTGSDSGTPESPPGETGMQEYG